MTSVVKMLPGHCFKHILFKRKGLGVDKKCAITLSRPLTNYGVQENYLTTPETYLMTPDNKIIITPIYRKARIQKTHYYEH